MSVIKYFQFIYQTSLANILKLFIIFQTFSALYSCKRYSYRKSVYHVRAWPTKNIFSRPCVYVRNFNCQIKVDTLTKLKPRTRKYFFSLFCKKDDHTQKVGFPTSDFGSPAPLTSPFRPQYPVNPNAAWTPMQLSVKRNSALESRVD